MSIKKKVVGKAVGVVAVGVGSAIVKKMAVKWCVKAAKGLVKKKAVSLVTPSKDKKEAKKQKRLAKAEKSK